jgi:hypothetical protein
MRLDRNSSIAAWTVGGLLLGVVAFAGPGGLHGLAYWSSPPSVQVQGAVPEVDAPSDASATSAEVGAVAGDVEDSPGEEAVPLSPAQGNAPGEESGGSEVPPRLPLGEEPLPALPYALQERVYRAYERPAVETSDVGDVPPLSVEPLPAPDEEARALQAPADEAPATEEDGEAPEPAAEPTEEPTQPAQGAGEPADGADQDGPAEPADEGAEAEGSGTSAEISRLARLAGAEMARGFLEELRRQAPAQASGDGTAPPDEALPPAEEDTSAVAGETLAEDVQEAPSAAQARTPRDGEELTPRERIALEAAATATALQTALVPLLSSPQAPVPVQGPTMQGPPVQGPTVPGPALQDGATQIPPPTTATVPPTGAPGLSPQGAPPGSVLSPITPLATGAATGGGPSTGGVAPNTIAPGSIIPAPATGTPGMVAPGTVPPGMTGAPGMMAPGTVVPGMTGAPMAPGTVVPGLP